MPIYINRNADFDVIYPPAYPIMALNTGDSLGTYGMQTVRDYSGQGHELVTAATFDTEGMVCTPTDSSADTQIVEPQNMTAIIALNISAADTAGNIFSCLTPAAAPWTGWRLTQGTDGVGRILVGTGQESPSTVTLDIGTITGGWTCFGITVSDTNISFLRSNGTAGSSDITGNRAKGTNTIYINGAPSTSPLQTGVTGKIGSVAVYNSVMTIGDIALEINNMRTFMATKGVTLP